MQKPGGNAGLLFVKHFCSYDRPQFYFLAFSPLSNGLTDAISNLVY